HALLEEAIDRALLPSWGDVNRTLEDQSASLVEGLTAAGWRKACAESLVEYAHKFSASRRERKRDEEKKPTWYS
ncbi:MAG: hypothetical protein V1757_01180, partial [Actinomycetota bacterium]